MARHNKVGAVGEKLASEFLVNNGYKILHSNWRIEKLEIDIICKDDNHLVFVEVKTRSTDFYGAPHEAVTLSKQQKLIEAADFYLQQTEIDLEPRFDVISIVDIDNPKITHFCNAFAPSF